jgi:aryl-alcohol dehydrogenase-like predicted oxidoreductase
MEYRRLGRSALRVSPIALGTMNFGPHTPADDAHRILDRAVDGGVNFIDTADQYGGALGVGTTETILGDWLAGRTDRDSLVLATKVHEPMADGPNDRGLSAYHIRRACEASLRRLRVDHIDLYQLHHLDRAASWDEVLLATDRLVAAGTITYLGTSNFPGWSIASGMERSVARGAFGPVSEQSLYHLANRAIEMEVVPAAQHYGIGILPWSPLGGGLLAGAPDGDSKRRRAAHAGTDAMRERLDLWEQLCAELGQPPAVVATAWLRDRPGVVAPIVGVRTEAQLDDAFRSLDVTLDAETNARLDEIFPGPGPAPEAYAW